jgi:hypothetical protein
MVVSATRILDGILKIVEDNIKTVDSFGTESWRTIDPGTLNPMRQKLEAPPRYEIIPQLGNLGREIIDNYFLLCVKIDDFRKPTAATNADSLHKEIDTIRKIVTGLREEIGQEGNKAHDRFAEERRQ